MEEKSGRFALDGRVGGDDDFFDGVGIEAGEEFFDVEVGGGDAVDGRNGAAENVVGAVVLFGLFDSIDVERLLDDKNDGFVTAGVGVELGKVGTGVNQGEGFWAGFDAGVKVFEGGGDVFGESGAGTKKIISVALSGARANSGEMAESLDGVLESFGEH